MDEEMSLNRWSLLTDQSWETMIEFGKAKKEKPIDKKAKDLALIKERKKASLAKKIDMGIVSEKGFSNLVKQLTLGEECDIKGNYSYETHMVLDFITDKLCRDKEFIAHLVIDRDPENPYTVADIQNYRKEWETIEIWATDGEIKKTLGLKRMSNREINRAVEDCADLEFEGKLHFYCDVGKGEWKSYDVGGAEKHFFGFVREKSGKIASRTGYEENIYRFTFNTFLSDILLTHIMNGNLQIKPIEFYGLRGGIQNMLNHVLMWKGTKTKPTILKLDEACALFGITTENVTRQQELCEADFNVAKKEGYIEWSPTRGKGKKKRYMVWVKERLLKTKETKLLPEKLKFQSQKSKFSITKK